MQRISVNLTNDCDGYQLNYNNDLLAIGNKNHVLQKPFETDFLTVTRYGPRHPIFHTNIFFYIKLFATIFYREIH